MALHAVKIARERPDLKGRSLSPWDRAEIAGEPVRDGIVERISVESVRQRWLDHRLRPRRHPLGLSPEVPRDAAFAAAVREIAARYTRPLRGDEIVLCVGEKTDLQPRPRQAPTLAAQPERPVRVEREYGRCGALHLFAAFDARSGRVYGRTAERKRQVEFIALLEQWDREIPATIRTIHRVLDNLRMHKGKRVRAWLKKRPRCGSHHPPVHCSGMNQVERWFGIVPRKRLRIADSASKEHLAERLMAFVREWNEKADRFNWTAEPFEEVLAQCEWAEKSETAA